VLIFPILSHPYFFMIYYYLLVNKLLFLAFLQFKGDFARGQNNSKYRTVSELLEVD